MDELQAIATIWLRDLIRFSRDRAQILGALSRPLLWLLILGVGMGRVLPGVAGTNYLEFIFPGIIALNLLFASFLSAISIIWDREFGFLKEILVSPIRRSSVALAKAASGATIAVLQGLIVIAFVPFLGISLSLPELLKLIPFMFMLAFSCTSIGILIASRMTSFEGFGTISNFIIMPMFFLSGAVFPVDSLPVWMAALVRVNPVAYGVDGMRSIVLSVSSFGLLFDIVFVSSFALVTLLLAVVSFSWTKS